MKVIATKSKFIFLLLIFTFLLSNVFDADARRRRHYNPEKTKQQAIQILRSTSEELSLLAGFEPLPADSIDPELLEDLKVQSELLTEEMIEDDLAGDVEIIDATYEMEQIEEMWLEYVDEAEDYDITQSGIKKEKLMGEIVDWLGTPYRFGGNSEKAIDCSAFIQQVFKNVAEVELPRTARTQVNVGDKIDKDNLEFGDLIFFHTYSRRFASHVGIYLGEDLFVHASSRYGVTISSLNGNYYQRRYIGARRITVEELDKFSIYKDETEEDKYSIQD